MWAHRAVFHLTQEERQMQRKTLTSLSIAMLAALTAGPSLAQQTPPAAPAPAAAPAAPPFAVTKVEGTDNVYIFRYGGHQAMFVVTKDGVIATDPIGRYRPQAVTTYIDEIRKITKAPIKYVVYSHHHYDHIAGGKPFKDQGAVFIAHRRAKERLAELKFPDVVIPDQVVDGRRSIKLGGTTLDLVYVGRNHSDNTLLMHLPKEKIIFAVDFLPVNSVHWRNMPDSWPIEWEESMKRVLAMDWNRMIPGHPVPGGGGRLGTKDDVKNLLAYTEELRTETKKAADGGRCMDNAIKEVRLPKYATLANYENWMPMNVERYCLLWSGGM